jgi:GNAT superfamily N-acetyltransferase
MNDLIPTRFVQMSDYASWLPLWDGYNAFYGRSGETALPKEVTDALWQRLFDERELVFGLVAERNGLVVGMCHYLFHRSTTKVELVCYLQDLFTALEARGLGIGRALISAVSENARAEGISRVYWHTNQSNAVGRILYDKVGKHTGGIVYVRESA